MKKKFRIKQQLDLASYDILKLVKDNLDCLLSDLPSLAYILWKWDRLSHSGRYFKDDYSKDFKNNDAYGICENNPKYALELVTDGLNENDFDLVYDAWAVSVSNEGYFKNTWRNFYSDSNIKKVDFSKASYENIKTRLMRDWPSLFPNDFSIRDHLFCVIGTGLCVSDGNIYDKTNVNDRYFGYEQRKDSLPKEVSDKFFEIINREECKLAIENAMKNSLSDIPELNTLELQTTYRLFKQSIKKDVENYEEKYDIKAISTKEEFVNVVDYFISECSLLKNEYSREDIIGQLLCLKEQCLEDGTAYEEAKKNPEILDSFRSYSKIFINLTSIPEEELYPKEYKEHRKFLFEGRETKDHYPCCLEYSLLFKYKNLNDDYKDALILTAQELLEDEKQTDNVKEECKNLLKYFSK